MLFLKLLCAFGILLSLTSLTTSPPPAPPPVNPPAPSGPTPKPKNAKRGKNITTGAPIKVTIVDEELRLTNWCVTGKDEPEMQYFPYSEFQPYLARTSSSNRRLRDDVRPIQTSCILFPWSTSFLIVSNLRCRRGILCAY